VLDAPPVAAAPPVLDAPPVAAAPPVLDAPPEPVAGGERSINLKSSTSKDEYGLAPSRDAIYNLTEEGAVQPAESVNCPVRRTQLVDTEAVAKSEYAVVVHVVETTSFISIAAEEELDGVRLAATEH
jgi:hypothetical protein